MKTYQIDWTQPDVVYSDRKNPETGAFIQVRGETMTGGSLKIKAHSQADALDFFCKSNGIRYRDLAYEIKLIA